MPGHNTSNKPEALSTEELLIYYYDKQADIYNQLDKPVDKHQSTVSTSLQAKSETSAPNIQRTWGWARKHAKWIFSGIGVPIVGAVISLVVGTCSTPQAPDDTAASSGDTIIQNDANQPINIQGGVDGDIIINNAQPEPTSSSTATGEPEQAAAVTPTSDAQSTATSTSNIVGATATFTAEPVRENPDDGLPPTATPWPPPPPSINVTNNPGRSRHPRIAFDQAGNLHLFYHDNTLRQGNGEELLHRRFYNDTWSNVTILSEGMDLLYATPVYPLTHPNGTLCVFWWAATVSTRPSTIGMYSRCYEDGQLVNPLACGNRSQSHRQI